MYREKKKLKQNYLQGNFRFFVNPNFDLDIRCMFYFDMEPLIKVNRYGSESRSQVGYSCEGKDSIRDNINMLAEIYNK